MVIMRTDVCVPGLSGRAVTDFFLNCTDQEYQRWWPGTHLAFHTSKSRPGIIGSLVWFDEYVGRRRLRFRGAIEEYIPGVKIVWRLRKLIDLPARLSLAFTDTDTGVRIRHTLAAGFDGPGRILDPLLRLYLSRGFERDLDEHARLEFGKLGAMLAGEEQ